MIKRIFSFVLFAGFVAVIVIYSPKIQSYIKRWIYFSFCDRQITYTVDKVDPKFNLTKEQVIKYSAQAAKMWNDMLGKDLFVYDPVSQLDINMVYDARQENIEKINEGKIKVESEKSKLDVNISSYESKRADIEKRLSELNNEIEYWNSQGGARSETYNTLRSRQSALQNEINALNQMGDKLNNTTDNINSKITSVNENVNKFNELLTTTPEEGLFIGSTYSIEVYIFENATGFVYTLAHEFGHALGLGHNNDSDALMYKTSSPTTKVSESDKQLLLTFCTKQNRLDLIKNDLKNVYLNIISRSQ
ncbi:hypothetical protein A2V49_00205 [candidate division WWE3 bacterium RBG_19FT_COMBO_34_6]|uniref:Peptidase M10 metallopeptidase domain-containing protein n=1 Tax=candidate division WWE3 bacterium RBG_19FT_COMBO_34_6 TaxID=1802612 RepID=A0A1F4ULH7_UNCKA|nr:MAG: hypothetical protein A2V49_00205 [candidate division WWE3 bacterium RBG_19FT_COMBO_34_6]